MKIHHVKEAGIPPFTKMRVIRRNKNYFNVKAHGFCMDLRSVEYKRSVTLTLIHYEGKIL